MKGLESIAIAIASGYHGRPAERDFVLGEATGGYVFVGCAREAVKAVIDYFHEQAREAKYMQDRDAHFCAAETLIDLLAEPVEQVPLKFEALK